MRKPRTAALGGVESLTASERRVTALAAGGHTNRDIAQELYVTPKTVEVHLSNAYRKLGIRSRRDLAGALMPGLGLARRPCSGPWRSTVAALAATTRSRPGPSLPNTIS